MTFLIAAPDKEANLFIRHMLYIINTACLFLLQSRI